MIVLGIDIGGSGIKGAPVDVETGTLSAERFRIPTPQPSKPKPVTSAVREIVEHFDWEGPMGCTFPSPITHGIVQTAANMHDKWIGVDGRKLLEKKTGCPVVLLNDGDAAGIAEMRFGAGKGVAGLVFVLTFGSGIGTALFSEGVLVPNCELGHLQMTIPGREWMDAEHHASDRARRDEGLLWSQWADRINCYLKVLDDLFWPDLYIVGGGVSRKHERWVPLLKSRAEIVPAKLLNDAGIVGAALAAAELPTERT